MPKVAAARTADREGDAGRYQRHRPEQTLHIKTSAISRRGDIIQGGERPVCIRNCGNIGAVRLFLLFVTFFTLVSCERSSNSAKDKGEAVTRAQNSQSAPGQGNKKSKEATNISSRAEYIKKQIEKYKEWGGHSVIPQRVTTMNTLTKVMKEIGPKDSAALILLLQDDADEIRSMAASLLGCVDPNAQSEIEHELAREKSIDRQYRLREALIVIRSIQEGRTSCK